MLTQYFITAIVLTAAIVYAAWRIWHNIHSGSCREECCDGCCNCCEQKK